MIQLARLAGVAWILVGCASSASSAAEPAVVTPMPQSEIDKILRTYCEVLERDPVDPVILRKLHHVLMRRDARPSAESRRARGLLARLSSESTAELVPADEPGEPLWIEGVVRDARGAAVAGVSLRVFQADAGGAYTPRAAMDESAPRLFAHLRTGPDGSYAFRTIRPGGHAEPVVLGGVSRLIPQHVHIEAVLGERRRAFQLVFEDDPRMDTHWRAWAAERGFPLVRLTRDAEGIQRGRCDIVLR